MTDPHDLAGSKAAEPGDPDPRDPGLRDPNGASRRLLVGTAGLIATAGVAATLSSPAGAWAAPAVKQILGVPNATASGDTGVHARITFDGTQSPSNAAGTIVTVPATVVFANVGVETTVPAGTRIRVSLSYEGTVLTFDRAASAAAAALNGSADSSLVALADSLFVLQTSLAPGATVVIPLVVTVLAAVAPVGDGTASAFRQLTGTDDSPPEDRSAFATTTISGTPSQPNYYEYTFDGSRQTVPSPSGAIYSYPAFLRVTKGPDEDPYNTQTLYIGIAEQAFPFALQSAATRRNGVEDAQAGGYDPGGRFANNPGFFVRLPLAVGDVVEFPLYALEPRDVTTPATGALSVTSSVEIDLEERLVYASASATVVTEPPVTDFFDAALAFSGSLDNGVTANLPEALQITAANANPLPAGLIAKIEKKNNHSLGSIGTPTIDGRPHPGAVELIEEGSEWPIYTFLVRVAVPAGSTLAIPLGWNADWADSSRVTAELITSGRDEDARNNTVSRALTLV